MNELNRHKNSDKIKWIITFTALLLITVMLIGMCLQMFGTEGQKPTDWFDKENKEPIEENKDNPEKEQTSTGLQVSDIVADKTLALASMPIAVADYETYGVSAAAESAMLLRCTVLPEDCTNKAVNWSIEWGSGDTTWTQGKNVNDYISLTANGNEATLSSLNAFGCSINIVCTSSENPEISSVCTLGYVKRVVKVELGFESDDNITEDFESYHFYRLRSYNGLIPAYRVTYSDGTVEGEFKGGKIITTLSDELYAILYKINPQTQKSTPRFIDADLSAVSSKEISINDVYVFINGESDADWYQQLYYYVNAKPQNVHATISMPYSYKYTTTEGNTMCASSGTATCDIMFSTDLLRKAAESVSLDNTSLYL